MFDANPNFQLHFEAGQAQQWKIKVFRQGALIFECLGAGDPDAVVSIANLFMKIMMSRVATRK